MHVSKDSAGAGSKRKLSWLWSYLEKVGDVDKLKRDIDDVVIKTLISAIGVLGHSYRACKDLPFTLRTQAPSLDLMSVSPCSFSFSFSFSFFFLRSFLSFFLSFILILLATSYSRWNKCICAG